MPMKLLQMLNRLEALSLRERLMVLLGAPLVLVVAGELLVFGPVGKEAAEAQKQADGQQDELKALSAVLAAQPAVAPLLDDDEDSDIQAMILGDVEGIEIAPSEEGPEENVEKSEAPPESGSASAR